ncbi:MAG: kelch repeat-containing protein [bacterium]
MNYRRLFSAMAVLTCVVLQSVLALADEGWIFKRAMPTARAEMSVAVLDGKIYVMGGRDANGKVLDVVERYDPAKDKWETLPPLRQDRFNAAAVAFEGKIFVLGGRSGEGEVLKKVEFFDFSKDKWENFPNLDEDREGHMAVVLNNTLYALGGSDEKEAILDDVEFFDSGSGRWRRTRDWELEKKRASFVAVTLNDSAFSIGGFTAFGPTGSVERYHPNGGNAVLSSLPQARGSLAASVRGDTIFVMGGRSASDQVLDSVEFFVPALNAWQEFFPLNTARENAVAATVADRMYIIGGRDRNGNVLKSVEQFVVSTSVPDPVPPVPTDFGLEQNYPNPFNAGTKITFRVSAQFRLAKTRLAIYNLLGKRVTTLVDDLLNPGRYEVLWDGNDENDLPVSSGVYFYILQQGGKRDVKKMSLLR